MKNLTREERIDQIITFLKSLNINSKRFSEIITSKNDLIIEDFHAALTHSSANQNINYEKLEFFGDAVLRLAASNFIDKKFTHMSVGKRSELRSQIVSDEWLIKVGKKIDIDKVIIKGSKALGDANSKDTIIGEATEALIGAIYKCSNSIMEVNLWLDNFWEDDSKAFLEAPYKFNAKSTLQEWCQSQGLDLPAYKVVEISKNHGDPQRFSCEIFIKGFKEAYGTGQSHKKAEKNAANSLLEKLIADGKI